MSDLQPARPPRTRIELLIEIDRLKIEGGELLAACKAARAAIEFRGKASMACFGELADDESNWREGVEPYLLKLHELVCAAISEVEGPDANSTAT